MNINWKRKTALWLFFRGGIDEGCYDSFNDFQSPAVAFVKHIDKLINFRIFRLFFRVENLL